MTQPKSFATAEQIPPGFWEITIDDVAGLDDGVRLIDVREPNELAAVPMLPGAESAPMSSIQHEIPKWDTSDAVVLICAGGVRSARVALYMQQQGFDNVVSLRGGMMAHQMRIQG